MTIPATLRLCCSSRRSSAPCITCSARELVGYTEAVDPGNADARDLENSLDRETGYTFHTSASYAHEVTTGSPAEAENLTTYGFENTWSGYLLPRSQSFISLYYLPSESPSGGIQGSVAPWQILFRQTTYLTPRLTLRYGAGMVRYGPESSVAIPSQTDNITSAGFRPIGFADFNYAFNQNGSDFGLRTAITYTPVATHLGVVEDRISLGLDFHPSSRSTFFMESYANQDSSIHYGHDFQLISPTVTVVGLADRLQGLGTTFRLDHRFIQRQAVTIDLGYDGLVFAYTGNSLPYLGFFEPTFYQRHYLTSRIGLKLRGPVGFEFYSGEGFQQIERGTRLTPAFLLSPSFTIRASERLKLSIGYSHYNNAESLGTLRGDAFHLTTDWRF